MSDGNAKELTAPQATGPQLSTDVYQQATEAEAVLKTALEAPGEFTRDLDRELDALEDALFDRGLGALILARTEEAAPALRTITSLRETYLELMDKIGEDDAHPLHDDVPDLRSFATLMKHQAEYVDQLRKALEFYRNGEAARAIEALDRSQSPEPIQGAAQVAALNLIMTRITSELLAAQIRQSVRDFAGARAAYSRAVSISDAAFIDVDPEFGGVIRYQRTVAESGSLRMQFAQLVQQQDFARAADVAQHAAEKLVAAADYIAEDKDLSAQAFLVLQVFLRSCSREYCAKAEETQAEIALERADWDAAYEHARTAAKCYEDAASLILTSGVPIANLFQEKLLNQAFELTAQFRRRVDRDRLAHERTKALEAELKELYASLRGAFAPAGVTINNQADLVNEVQQQIEFVNHVEAGVRQSLRELPQALEDSGIPGAQDLGAEALTITDMPAGPAFKDRVKKFTRQLADAVAGLGSVAEPVVAILKALAILP